MASNIDITKPVTGNATTQSVRDNFAAAKTEIEALQAGKANAQVDASGTLSALLNPDGSVRPIKEGGILAVIAGDSRTQENIDQTSTAITKRQRWFNWMNALMGQRFELVNNAGVSGNTASQLLARIATSNYGAGFGALGDTTTPVSTNPGAYFSQNAWVFLEIGINDIFGASATAADTFAITKQICDKILSWGNTLVLCSVIAPNSAAVGYTTAKAKELVLYNNMLKSWADANRGVIFVDSFGAVVSPTAAVIETPAAYLRDGVNHGNNLEGYLRGKLLADTLAGIVPKRTGILPTSNAIVDTLDANIPQIQPNPLQTGTAAITATGYSGTTANSNLANANFVRGGSPTAVLSAVTRADGYGQNIKFACTFAAKGDTLELRYPSLHAKVSAGQKYYAVAEVSYTGPGGAALAQSDNLTGVQISLQYNNGTTNYFAYDFAMQSSTDGPLKDSQTLVLKTPILEIPSGGTPTTFRLNMTILANGIGTPEVQIGRVAIYKVST